MGTTVQPRRIKQEMSPIDDACLEDSHQEVASSSEYMVGSTYKTLTHQLYKMVLKCSWMVENAIKKVRVGNMQHYWKRKQALIVKVYL